MAYEKKEQLYEGKAKKVYAIHHRIMRLDKML